MIAVSNIMLIFASTSIHTGRDTASILRADFLCSRLNQYWYSTPSSSVNAPAAPCEWKSEGQAVPLLLSQPHEQIYLYDFHRINLFASEQQYLTSNALCSDMHRLIAQPLQQRGSTFHPAIRNYHRNCLPWSHKNPVQKERQNLCDAGEKEPKNFLCKRLYATERRPQFPFIIQLFIVSVVLKLVHSAAEQCSAAKNNSMNCK